MQHTLSRSITFEGIGIHSGETVRCVVEPAPVDSGFKVRLADGRSAPLDLDHVVSTDHATTLVIDGKRIMTVEHLLSALYGCGVDNAVVALEGGEVPILDGSALPFAREILPLVTPQDKPCRMLVVTAPFTFRDGDKWLSVEPYEGHAVHASIVFAHPKIGEQEGRYEVTPEVYLLEIAPARTFGFIAEVQKLQAAGLIKGASMENAIVYDDTEILNPPLRFPTEALRHKILDAIGDLSLLGGRLRGLVRTHRGGHGLHCQAARALLASGVLAPRLD